MQQHHHQRHIQDSDHIDVTVDSSVLLHATNEMIVINPPPSIAEHQKHDAGEGKNAGSDASSKLSKIFNKVALGTKMQLASNASQVEKFQDKASRNASLVAKAAVSNTQDKEDTKGPKKTSASDGQILLGRRSAGAAAATNFECKVFRMKCHDKDVHIMWARKYAAELYGNEAKMADSTGEILESIKRLHMSSSDEEVARVMQFLRAEAARRRGAKSVADVTLLQQIDNALTSKSEQMKLSEQKKEQDIEAARLVLQTSVDNTEIAQSFVTLLSLGNDETCVGIMRMVHAVIESGGIAILQQAGVTSALVNKIKVNMKTPLLPMVLALLCLMSEIRESHSVFFDMGFMPLAAALLGNSACSDTVIVNASGIVTNMCLNPEYPDAKTSMLHSGLISSVIATLNRTTVTSDALTSLYDLLHSVLAGKDYIQEPFLSEGGAAALLHAMSVISEPASVAKGVDVLRHCCSSLHARRILCNSGCIERLADVIHRTQGRHNVCCIAAIRTLVHIAEKSSIGIRETYVTSGCLKLLLELLAAFPESEISEYIVLVLYHLSTGLPQFHEVLRSFNAIQLLLDCIASVRLVNTVVYSLRTLFNLIEFHEASQLLLQEAHGTRVLRDALVKAGKGDEEIKKHVRTVMQKAKIKERAGCSML